MKTLELHLDDSLAESLFVLSVNRNTAPEAIVGEAVRRYVDGQNATVALESSALVTLYGELAGEDLALAEAGLQDYQGMLHSADEGCLP